MKYFERVHMQEAYKLAIENRHKSWARRWLRAHGYYKPAARPHSFTTPKQSRSIDWSKWL